MLSGIYITKNGRQEAHIRKKIRKVAAVMGQMWGIEKKGLEEVGEKDYGYLTSWYGRC